MTDALAAKGMECANVGGKVKSLIDVAFRRMATLMIMEVVGYLGAGTERTFEVTEDMRKWYRANLLLKVDKSTNGGRLHGTGGKLDESSTEYQKLRDEAIKETRAKFGLSQTDFELPFYLGLKCDTPTGDNKKLIITEYPTNPTDAALAKYVYKDDQGVGIFKGVAGNDFHVNKTRNPIMGRGGAALHTFLFVTAAPAPLPASEDIDQLLDELNSWRKHNWHLNEFMDTMTNLLGQFYHKQLFNSRTVPDTYNRKNLLADIFRLINPSDPLSCHAHYMNLLRWPLLLRYQMCQKDGDNWFLRTKAQEVFALYSPIPNTHDLEMVLEMCSHFCHVPEQAKEFDYRGLTDMFKDINANLATEVGHTISQYAVFKDANANLLDRGHQDAYNSGTYEPYATPTGYKMSNVTDSAVRQKVLYAYGIPLDKAFADPNDDVAPLNPAFKVAVQTRMSGIAMGIMYFKNRKMKIDFASLVKTEGRAGSSDNKDIKDDVKRKLLNFLTFFTQCRLDLAILNVARNVKTYGCIIGEYQHINILMGHKNDAETITNWVKDHKTNISIEQVRALAYQNIVHLLTNGSDVKSMESHLNTLSHHEFADYGQKAKDRRNNK